jgi:D-glycero-alpha-D-manno-heptose-7-phosphate kinase
MVDEDFEFFTATGALDSFGHLLHEAWELKRSLSGAVSNSEVDGIVHMPPDELGALGGKLLGQRAEGVLILFYANPECHARKGKLLGIAVGSIRFRFGWQPDNILFSQQDYAALDQLRSTALRRPDKRHRARERRV